MFLFAFSPLDIFTALVLAPSPIMELTPVPFKVLLLAVIQNLTVFSSIILERKKKLYTAGDFHLEEDNVTGNEFGLKYDCGLYIGRHRIARTDTEAYPVGTPVVYTAPSRSTPLPGKVTSAPTLINPVYDVELSDGLTHIQRNLKDSTAIVRMTLFPLLNMRLSKVGVENRFLPHVRPIC